MDGILHQSVQLPQVLLFQLETLFSQSTMQLSTFAITFIAAAALANAANTYKVNTNVQDALVSAKSDWANTANKLSELTNQFDNASEAGEIAEHASSLISSLDASNSALFNVSMNCCLFPSIVGGCGGCETNCGCSGCSSCVASYKYRPMRTKMFPMKMNSVARKMVVEESANNLRPIIKQATANVHTLANKINYAYKGDRQLIKEAEDLLYSVEMLRDTTNDMRSLKSDREALSSAIKQLRSAITV